MLKIAKSLFTIVAIVGIAAGSTSAYFTDKATIIGNTFATGKLEIRINGQQTIIGQQFLNNVPGDVNNSEPYLITNSLILGHSTVNAKKLLLSANHLQGNDDLKNAVKIKVEARKGPSGSWTEIYKGKLAGLDEKNILSELGMNELKPYNMINGQIIGLRYRIGVQETDTNQNYLMNKQLSWDFAIEGRTN
jgi:predicted ribosomally synthesized peptide with SipW-like signal peptide